MPELAATATCAGCGRTFLSAVGRIRDNAGTLSKGGGWTCDACDPRDRSLRARRLALGLSADAAGSAVRISDTTIKSWERGAAPEDAGAHALYLALLDRLETLDGLEAG